MRVVLTALLWLVLVGIALAAAAAGWVFQQFVRDRRRKNRSGFSGEG